MKNIFEFKVHLEQKNYLVYAEIADFLNKPIENLLSDTLNKYVEILIRECKKNKSD